MKRAAANLSGPNLAAHQSLSNRSRKDSPLPRDYAFRSVLEITSCRIRAPGRLFASFRMTKHSSRHLLRYQQRRTLVFTSSSHVSANKSNAAGPIANSYSPSHLPASSPSCPYSYIGDLLAYIIPFPFHDLTLTKVRRIVTCRVWELSVWQLEPFLRSLLSLEHDSKSSITSGSTRFVRTLLLLHTRFPSCCRQRIVLWCLPSSWRGS